MAWQNPNPYKQDDDQAQPQQAQPSWNNTAQSGTGQHPATEWSGAGGSYTSGGGPSQGSVYNQYAPQTFAQQSQARSQPASPQSWSYPQSGNYAPPQPSWSAPQYPTGSQGARPAQGAGGVQDASQAIADAYRQYLGRDASQQEINARVGQQGFNLGTHVRSIQQSPEAAAYQQRQAQQPPQPPQGSQQPGYPTQMPPGGAKLPSDPRGWNTDNYPKPGWVAQQPSRNPPPGWEASKWNNPNHQTPKYVVGRILSQYQPRTQNMDAVVAEIARAYPGTRRTGSGDITIPGIGSTDILKAADVGGKGWHFGGQSKGSQASAAPAQAGGYPGGMDPYTALLQQLVQPQYGAPPTAYGPQSPPAESQELQLLRQQMATMQQQMQAQQQAQRRTSPQFSYY